MRRYPDGGKIGGQIGRIGEEINRAIGNGGGEIGSKTGGIESEINRAIGHISGEISSAISGIGEKTASEIEAAHA